MNAAQLTATIESAVMLVILLVLCFRLVATHRLAAFRQQMFAVRDELFDYAADGNIGFNDPAYRLLRQSMNGFIRYAHQLTFFRLCMTSFKRKIEGGEQQMLWHEKWQESLYKVRNQEVKEKLIDFQLRSYQIVLDRVVSGSPVCVAMVLVVVVMLFLRGGWQNLKRAYDKASASAVSHVINPKSVEEDAAACAAA